MRHTSLAPQPSRLRRPNAGVLEFLHGIVGELRNDVEQFKQPGKEVILYPPQYKSAELLVPFEPAP